MNLEEIKKKVDNAGYWGDISPNEIEKDIEYLISIIERHQRTFVKIQELCVNAENSQVPLVNLDTIRQVAKVAIDENRT